MSKVHGYARKMTGLLLILLLPGCAIRQTYEESKYQFSELRGVLMEQSAWVQPDVLQIYKISSRREICRICNNVNAGGKGSHFKIYGLHRPTIQDRGCYVTNTDFSVGRVYYLEGDQVAKAHELAHHYHGPKHEKLRPWLRWSHMNTAGSRYSVAVTGSRIGRTWRQR
jgi:hypothetical protein